MRLLVYPTVARLRRPATLIRASFAVGALVAFDVAAAEQDAWTRLPDLNEARQEVAAAVLEGAVYVVGGFGSERETLASAERLAPGDDAWELLPPMPVAVNHPAAAALDGRLYVVGGFAGPGLANAVEAVQVFDPTSRAWRLAAPLPRPRGALAAAVHEGRLFAVGGARDGASLADVAVYDPTADAWTELPPLPTARDHLGVAVLAARLHALGGRAAGDLTLDTHEVLDLAAETWSDAPPLPTGRSGHAVAALDGCLYALGGEGHPRRPGGVFDEVERFVSASGTWETLEAMPLPRHGMGAVAVDGRLLVPGGATVAGYGAVATADAFAPPPCPD